MTYDNLKSELMTIRENRQERDRIYAQIEELNRRKYDCLTRVTDTTQEPTTRSTRTDDYIIGVLQRHEARTKALYKKLDKLPPENEDIKKAVYNLDTLDGTILLYYIQGNHVKTIAKWINISPSYVYTRVNKAIEALWYSLPK